MFHGQGCFLLYSKVRCDYKRNNYNNQNLSEESIAGEVHEEGTNRTSVMKCCSGLCVDLLRKFEDDLGFSYVLVRADDPKWGTFEVVIRSSDIVMK